MSKPPEPQFLIDYREWLKAGPPKCCHTCDHYYSDGSCSMFDMVPPDEFVCTQDACEEWEEIIPF